MPTLTSFPDKAAALVVGANGGIGRAFLDRLAADPAIGALTAWARRPVDDCPAGVASRVVDITSEADIEAAAGALGPVNLVIVATGVLHIGTGLRPEKSWRDLSAENFATSFAVNAIGPALIAKHVLPLLPKDERACFAVLSARVSSIADNRLGGWYAYRASKAALNQVIRTLSIELARTRKQAVCVGLHPGTVDTDLSQPFQANVPPEKLFAPTVAAGHLLSVIDQLSPADSGGLYAWDGQRIPY